jgi:3,4-dihydroxy 2-butanone 4-phosphate synthase / GTP cyclohydrolase II
MKNISNSISPIKKIIEDAKLGKPFILVDDENRENEGDLIIPAEFITEKNIAFMIKHCSGIICLSITKQRAEMLNLEPMVQNNKSAFTTPFAVSIEAKNGITTGVSAQDRAKTIQLASALNAKPEDIVSPGHIFPLIAKDGGVLVRAGHTEASVDICKLANLSGSAVICEIMNEDGTMSRMPDLIEFATQHNIKIGTISDLIEYRSKNEKFLIQNFETTLQDGSKIISFKENHEELEHFAIIKGNVNNAVVRIQSFNLFDEISGEIQLGLLDKLKNQYQDLVFIIINNGRNWQASEVHVKDYGKGAEILKHLGLLNIKLLTKKKGRNFAGITGFGINIVDEILI